MPRLYPVVFFYGQTTFEKKVCEIEEAARRARITAQKWPETYVFIQGSIVINSLRKIGEAYREWKKKVAKIKKRVVLR